MDTQAVEQSDADPCLLVNQRLLPFPPGAVYGAFSDADCLSRWWGPDGFSNTFELFEFREGGRWVFVMHGPDGSNYHNESHFERLVPDREIVIRHACEPYFTLSVYLSPAQGGTWLRWEQLFDEAAVAAALRARCLNANEENLDRLHVQLDAWH